MTSNDAITPPPVRPTPVRPTPRCYFCGARDSMVPFRRSQRVLLFSAFLPIRWRYCRKCARHFLDPRPPRDNGRY